MKHIQSANFFDISINYGITKMYGNNQNKLEFLDEDLWWKLLSLGADLSWSLKFKIERGKIGLLTSKLGL